MFASKGVPAEEARDLAQDTVTRTIVHLRRHGRSADDLTPLLNTIARNLLIERVRRNRPALTELTEATEVADPTPGPDEAVLSEERRNRVREGLSQLTPRHRRVVQMWMEGLGPAQIAGELGIKRNAADALLHRARRRLAASLRQDSLLGIGALVLVGLRSRVRRAIAYATSLDPTGAVVPSGAGLAAVGMAAILTLGSVGAPPGLGAEVDAGGAGASIASSTVDAEDTTVEVDSIQMGRSLGAADSDADGSEPGVSVALSDDGATAKATTEDPNGEERGGQLDIWGEEDEDDPGIVGPVVLDGFRKACEAGRDICEEDGS